MKLVSWNVNGFRAAIRHGFYDFLEKFKPDIVAIQEIKQSDKPLIQADYEVFWNPAKKKGYAGTAVLTKIKPLSVSYGIGIDKFDDEGRVLTLEFEQFFLLNIYFPNSQHGLTRLDFKIEFDEALLKYAEKLRKIKPVVLVGDFNVAHEEIDIARPKSNEGNAGFTQEERRWMTKFLDKGYIDLWRYFHKDVIQYSWWSYRFNARAKNIGWRIDYIIASQEFLPHIKNVEILTDVLGSDHAPLLAEII